MSYGIFQEYYSNSWPLSGSNGGTGVIGTTSNGVIYLSMPILFSALSTRHARLRYTVAIIGVVLTALSFLLSSYSNKVWQIILTQGVLAAFGSALLYSPTTLYLGETFTSNHRAVAYGVVLSSKNIVGSTCPFLLQTLLDRYGLRITMQIWTGIVTLSSLLSLFLFLFPLSHHSVTNTSPSHHPRRTAWSFLHHRTIYIYSVATLVQSSGYGIPQTYLPLYAHSTTHLSRTMATLMLTLFSIPGIVSSSFFGYLSDNPYLPCSASTVTFISSASSGLAVFLLWGLAPASSSTSSSTVSSMSLLLVFSLIFGFFASAYSATWGAVIKQMEREAAERNEAVDPGVVYGLLNGARGVGYVTGGLVGVPLLKSSTSGIGSRGGYATEYGALIVFTGLCLVFGGWSVVWRWRWTLGSKWMMGKWKKGNMNANANLNLRVLTCQR
ncbi:hypothetical protein B0A52_02466 [Exophiala mesophila]|uniref:Major facilitator superfamily (MFS) profile domain-containing protein n=1 Tax=Exophiala mesophila TaxID=212818 RepID=A0A438ND17_EXOME|nr:hypothetical protein B0A52_02466 [Exophiala mesophila]